jgi:hypothetical protein
MKKAIAVGRRIGDFIGIWSSLAPQPELADRRFREGIIGIVRVAAAMPRKLPYESQSMILVKTRRIAIEDGLKP